MGGGPSRAQFLGAGAFANVFLVKDTKTGELYALKSILKALALKKNKHRQVKAEKLALELCDHANIIGLRAAFSDEQHVYLLMEIAMGGELFALIEEMTTIEEEQARFYAASVTLALEHLHSHGFIFRDMKPENLLLTDDGNLKLCDLGLAKRAERAWTMVGTPQYIAPEVLRGEGATRAVDWWGLGVLVFEMLCGSLPFEAPDDNDQELFEKIRRGSFEWPALLPRSKAAGQNPAAPPSAEARDFVGGLLRLSLPSLPDGTGPTDPADPPRLGSGPRGAAELKTSPWMCGFNWSALEAGDLVPPFTPQLAAEDDDSNFGPLEWRGDPILSAPEHDTTQWDELFDGW